jgi:hypothetical protein
MMGSLLVEAGHQRGALRMLKCGGTTEAEAAPCQSARVAIARKLAVRMYWILRAQARYAQLVRMQTGPSSCILALIHHGGQY